MLACDVAQFYGVSQVFLYEARDQSWFSIFKLSLEIHLFTYRHSRAGLSLWETLRRRKEVKRE